MPNRESQKPAQSWFGQKKPRRFATGHTRPDDKALTQYPLIRDYPDSDNTHLRGSSSRKKGNLLPDGYCYISLFPISKTVIYYMCVK